jgi:hypothetical protein
MEARPTAGDTGELRPFFVLGWWVAAAAAVAGRSAPLTVDRRPAEVVALPVVAIYQPRSTLTTSDTLIAVLPA